MKARRPIQLTVFALTLVVLLTVLATLGVNAANAKNSYSFDGVHITRETITIKEGGSFTLTLRKINAGDAEEIYTSENPLVATVKDGEVFAIAEGETTVTVTKGEFSDSVKVIVTKNDPAIE